MSQLYSNKTIFLFDSLQVFFLCLGFIYSFIFIVNGFRKPASRLTFLFKLPVAYGASIVFLYWMNYFEIFFTPDTVTHWMTRLFLIAMGLCFFVRHPIFTILAFLSLFLQTHVYFSNRQLGWMTYRNNDPVYYEFMAEYLKNHSFRFDVDSMDRRYSMNIVRQFVNPNSNFRIGHSVWDSFISNLTGIPSIRTVYLSASIPLALAIVSGAAAFRALVWERVTGSKYSSLLSFFLIVILSLNRSILDLIFEGFYPATHAIALMIMSVVIVSIAVSKDYEDENGLEGRLINFIAPFSIFAAIAAVYPEVLPFVWPCLGLVTLLGLNKERRKRSFLLILGALTGPLLMFPSMMRLVKGLSVLSGLSGQLLLNFNQYWLYVIGGTDADPISWFVMIASVLFIMGIFINLLRRGGSIPAERTFFFLFIVPITVGVVFLYKFIGQGNQYTVVRTLTIISPFLILLIFSQPTTWGVGRMAKTFFLLFCSLYLGLVINSVEIMKKILKVSLKTTRDQILLVESLRQSGLLRGKHINAEAAPQSILFQHYLSYLELVTESTFHFTPHIYNYGHPTSTAWLGLHMDHPILPDFYDFLIIPNVCALYETSLDLKPEVDNEIIFKNERASEMVYLAQSRSDWFFRPCKDLEFHELKMVKVNARGRVEKESLPPFAICSQISGQKKCAQVNEDSSRKVKDFISKNSVTHLTL